MSIVKRMFVDIIRKPFRTLILALLIIGLSLMSGFGIYLQGVVNQYFDQYVEKVGFSVSVFDTDNENWGNGQYTLEQDVIDRIMNLQHVVGYNNDTVLEEKFRPSNFKNVLYEDDSVYGNTTEEEEILLIANLDTSLDREFRSKHFELVEGEFPTLSNHGVVISEELAKENQLNIGSFIELEQGDETTRAFEVIGIYKVNIIPLMPVNRNNHTYYINAPNSFVFCDWTNFSAITTMDNKIPRLQFFVDKYDFIEPVYKEMVDLFSGQKNLILNNSLEDLAKGNSGVIQVLNRFSLVLLNLIYIASIVILCLMTILWMKDHAYEIAIYIALGKSRVRIALYYIGEILLVGIIVLAGFFYFGNGLMQKLGPMVMDYIISMSSVVEVIDLQMQERVIESVDFNKTMLVSDVVFLGAIFASTCISCVILLRKKIRYLFIKE